VKNVRTVKDGETLRVGKLALTAHFTPGHTPGGTTWTWKDCENGRCLDLVYADSLGSVSAPGFRFSGGKDQPSRVPEFQRSIAVVAALPCDILLAPHPTFIDVAGKLARRKENPSVNPFIDAGACKAYAAGAEQRLQQRLKEESTP
jgi:metallo-beta-lactamase class B